MNSLQRDISNKDRNITRLRNELRNAERERTAKHQELQREQKTHGDLQRISECTNAVEMIKLMDEKNPSSVEVQFLPWPIDCGIENAAMPPIQLGSIRDQLIPQPINWN